MNDLISRDEAIDAVGEAIADGRSWYDALVKLPSSQEDAYWEVIADPAEWGVWNAKCTNCGYREFFPLIFKDKYFKYCPNCMARMEGRK